MTFDWRRPCTRDARSKASFHATARSRLRLLARELRMEPGSYDLRSNKGGPAVSGEVTLHHQNIYIQAAQPATGHDSGLLVRTCKGRRDYTGGRNHLMPLSKLDDIPALADAVRRICPTLSATDPDASHDAPAFR